MYTGGETYTSFGGGAMCCRDETCTVSGRTFSGCETCTGEGEKDMKVKHEVLKRELEIEHLLEEVEFAVDVKHFSV